MNVLIDTHVFLWLNEAPEKLSASALQLCERSDVRLYLSLVSVWEIQIKQQLGKLSLSTPWQTMIQRQQQDNELKLLPIELSHIEQLQALPAVHRDPFDRLLIAQAIQESMTIVTSDQFFSQYPVALVS